MKIKRSIFTIVIIIVFQGVIFSNNIQAHEKGDVVVRVGVIQGNPKSSSEFVMVDSTVIENSSVGVDSNIQAGFTFSYILSDHWGIEFLAATPFEHDVFGQGVLSGVNIGNITTLPPVLTLQYFLNHPSARFQPYIGVGLSYMLMLDTDVHRDIEVAFGATKLNIDDAYGLSLQMGFDYLLSERWLFNLAVWKMDLDTTAKIDTAIGKLHVDLAIDPWAYMASVAYKF